MKRVFIQGNPGISLYTVVYILFKPVVQLDPKMSSCEHHLRGVVIGLPDPDLERIAISLCTMRAQPPGYWIFCRRDINSSGSPPIKSSERFCALFYTGKIQIHFERLSYYRTLI